MTVYDSSLNLIKDCKTSPFILEEKKITSSHTACKRKFYLRREFLLHRPMWNETHSLGYTFLSVG